MGDKVLEHLRKETVDIYNRLHSICEDAQFVSRVARDVFPGFPLVPNLRCGAWYVDPRLLLRLANATAVPPHAYFKSTDGHFAHWSFNLRRPNLHLLPLVALHNGVVLVDSTRAGKRLPDALSKTVPIWCAVVNRALARRYPRCRPWDTALYTPPVTVSTQEHTQIEQHLDAWADALFHSSFELPDLSHPLRPFWVTPSTTSFPVLPDKANDSALHSFLPVVCLSASRQIRSGTERRTNGFSYVQGSGDDHELWAMGLTPDTFWAHHHALISASRSELPNVVFHVVQENLRANPKSIDHPRAPPSPIARVGGRLFICALDDLGPLDLLHTAPIDRTTAYILIISDKHVSVTDQGDVGSQAVHSTPDLPDPRTSNLSLPLDPNHPPPCPYPCILRLAHRYSSTKRGQVYFLTHILPSTFSFIFTQLSQSLSRRVCVACDSGKDISVGVILAALGGLFDQDGKFLVSRSWKWGNRFPAVASKKDLRTKLEWIIASHPVANPTRATLKRVNEFLLTPGGLTRNNFRP